MTLNPFIVATVLFFILFAIVLIFGVIFLILWNRRKWIICRFLDSDGKWKRTHFKTMDSSFDYEDFTYSYDIAKTTRDHLNRPVSDYYIGNPLPIEYAYSEFNHKKMKVGTQEITFRDFRQILLTKIIKDIFSDDEVLTLLYIVMIISICGFLALVILDFAHNPKCNLSSASMDALKNMTCSMVRR